MAGAPVVVLAPTAAGKSDLAMAAASTVPGTAIVAVDAMQVYRGMDIGTAKPTLADQAVVPHHGIDLVEPTVDFAVADYRGHDEIRVIERRAVGVRESVAEFSAFMNRSWRLGCAVASDAAGERELLKELLQAIHIETLLRINLRVRAFQICGTENAARSMSGSREKNHIEIVFLDHAVQMDIGEGEAGTGSPMAEQPVLDPIGQGIRRCNGRRGERRRRARIGRVYRRLSLHVGAHTRRPGWAERPS